MPSSCDDSGLLDGVRDRQPVDAGHRLDRRALIGAELDEHRRTRGARPKAPSRAPCRAAARSRAGAACGWRERPSDGLYGRSGELRRSGAAPRAPARRTPANRAARCASAPPRPPASLMRGVERVERGLEREHRRHHPHDVVERTARRPPRARARGTPAGARPSRTAATTARTSRVSAPIARPRAANASAPAPIAATQRRNRPQSSETKRPSPASISRQIASEQTAASPAFSSSSAVRDTRPRTSRRKAFSSRSSASAPAASRRVMNISDTATAIAIANELSGVVAPSSLICLTLDRLADRVRAPRR